MKPYILRVLIQIDVLVMVILNGQRNETLSAVAYSLELDGKLAGRIFRLVIDALALMLGETNHCQSSWLTENQKDTHVA